ncbi:hypothetical protein PLICRDRAFT_154662 [Plicaturopsis crispa FD-325 SS-3]|nr:hypothetical protein PLICRDRAFT_154662 [Plicaturopsis crispa FD-325 SS-3]
MALITISGYPSSGKTRRAHQIKDSLEKRMQDESYVGPKLKVIIVSDDSLHLARTAYDESRSEKPARGALFTAMQREMGQDTILIVDALNYIKGFRYQMYCAAREQKLRVCTVFVVATHDLCREWNKTRQDGKAYAPDTLENLLVRYEEPSSMVRWDSPLFTVLWDEPDVPGEPIWQAVTAGNVKPPNAGTSAVPKAPSDALHTLEQTTTSMVAAILSEQANAPSVGGVVTISLSATLKPQITLPARNLTLSELQRAKRQFVTVHKKAITLGATEKGTVDWNEESIADKFVSYLEENLKP